MAIKTVFFDAAGTLIHLSEPVGDVYAGIAGKHGIYITPEAGNRGFRSAWKSLAPPVHPESTAPKDDDRAWWRRLVEATFVHATGKGLPDDISGPLFEELYLHFARPEAWGVYDDVRSTLEHLSCRCRLLVLSNFDKRLRLILAGHDLAKYFDGVILSSEVGASKPHPRMFAEALSLAQARPEECLHVGDDLKADIGGAQAAGMAAFRVDRPGQGLKGVLDLVG